MPCAILALIFGIIGVKKVGKGLAIAGIITGAIALVFWIAIFSLAFISGFVEGFNEGLNYYYYAE